MTREEAFGPHPRKRYSYQELPKGAVSIGIHKDTIPTGTWRSVRPSFVAKTPPCSDSCPAGVDIRGFLSLMKEGSIKEAYNLYVEENPFPSICGRVCYHPCEAACNRNEFDESVNINGLERFLSDFNEQTVVADSPSEKRVSIVGSGPSGLTCAYFLKLFGHKVTVFESADVIGGMLRTAIPDYRLPVNVIDKEVKRLKDLGIVFNTGSHVDHEVWKALEKDYDAILVACGAWKSLTPPIDMGDVTEKRVISGLAFLKSVKLGQCGSIGDKVVVVGGGNTAIDTARVLKQLGASPTIIYRRSRDEMPAFDMEISEALEEGVQILYLTSPVGFLKGPSGIRVKCIKNQLEEQRVGRKRPLPIEGSEFFIDTEKVICATGEISDLSFLPESIETVDQSIHVNVFGATNFPKIFASGDVTGQERTVTHAIGSGKMAAISIDCFLRGELNDHPLEDLKIGETGSISMKRYLKAAPIPDSQRVVRLNDINTYYFPHLNRYERPKLKTEERTGFQELIGNLSMDEAEAEAKRCFTCGMCDHCGNCFLFCPDSSIVDDKEAGSYGIDYDFCKGCGICVNECPRGAIDIEKEG